MKILMVQMNSTVGDFQGNREKILESLLAAQVRGVDLVVFPELSLCGYPPLDLLDFPSFLKANEDSLAWLMERSPESLVVGLGHAAAAPPGKRQALQNVVTYFQGKKLIHRQAKTLLPTYDVFDEVRYFHPAEESRVFTLQGLKIGTAICEDLWWDKPPRDGLRYEKDPVLDLVQAGAQLIVSPSASPFHPGKPEIRRGLLEQVGQRHGVPVLYVNAVGANDSLIFDGQSMASGPGGELRLCGPAFQEALLEYDTQNPPQAISWTEAAPEALLEEALCLGLKDYARKCGFHRVHLGLSGGIDSALTAALAVKALGPENVRGFALPSRYSSEGSLKDARDLANNLGISCDTIPIEGPFQSFLETLEPLFRGQKEDVTEENIQARIRGTLLMAWSNKNNSLLLTTGNKSELATGYCTLYGDMSGGLGVIGDLLKTEVYALSRHINRERELIPWSTITKAPSAELRPDQTDQDSLPPYEVLDSILKLYLIEHKSLAEICALDFPEETVSFVLRLVARAEYKRWQAPPVLKVSPRAFGVGRRHPLARRLFELET